MDKLAGLINELEKIDPIFHDMASIDKLKDALAGYVNNLITNDFEKLLRILYRIDVSEIKLKNLLKENTGQDAGVIIATLIIERQLQKIKTRDQLKKNSNNNETEW